MQINKIIQLAAVTFLMLLSMWAVSALLEVGYDTRNKILGVGFFVILLFSLWRKIPLDAKLLFIIILGYALGGKGFAYVSPVEPVYIGEICLALCMFGLMIRIRHAGLFDTSIHNLIWVYLIYAGIHLMVDYDQYRLLAIRDSATAYYSLYFFAAYSLFQNEIIVTAFERIMKIAIVFAIMQLVAFFFPLRFPGFYPHADAYIPLTVAAAIYFLIRAAESKKIGYILIGATAVVALITGKTAGVLALFGVLGVALVFGRVKNLKIPVAFIGVLGFVALAVATVIIPDFFAEHIGSGDTVEAFGIAEGEFVGLSGTSSWRMDWWMMIWDDTMKAAPFWGLGFGSDVSTAFLGEKMGELVRYPHNVIFTVIGRLGLIGLVIFITLFVAIGMFSIRFCSRYYNSPNRRDADLICPAVVIAGMINGIVQSTYEVPHGAITHWVCLGYMVARYYHQRVYNNTIETEAPKGS
jgi:hypothetical protein